jgi:hypothetical protein
MLKAGGSVEMASMASWCTGDRDTAAMSRWANPPSALIRYAAALSSHCEAGIVTPSFGVSLAKSR